MRLGQIQAALAARAAAGMHQRIRGCEVESLLVAALRARCMARIPGDLAALAVLAFLLAVVAVV